MVLREGLALTLMGVLPGAALAYAAGRATESLLVGVKPAEGLTMALVIATCGETAIIGCVRPALHASRVDPMAALRPE
jgi:ABC-type antimicrobial peptide transport system permease subunit